VSRIGKLPVTVPPGVKCSLSGSVLEVTGPKGKLNQALPGEMSINVGDAEIVVSRPSEKKDHRALHGLTRALIQNMMVGVTEGYEKTLLIEGVGYRASIQGKNLNLMLGFSHPVSVEPPSGIEFTVDGQQTIKVAGIDKQAVGQAAAQIRAFRKPEPYKGKGIRYSDEYVRRKVGKSGVK
jgi:large subunit ribosomal protein L6